MKARVLKIHPGDNVLVALQDLTKGESILYEGEKYVLQEDIGAKHKFFMKDMVYWAFLNDPAPIKLCKRIVKRYLIIFGRKLFDRPRREKNVANEQSEMFLLLEVKKIFKKPEFLNYVIIRIGMYHGILLLYQQAFVLCCDYSSKNDEKCNN